MEGLAYNTFRYKESDLHVLTVDLKVRTIKPIPVGEDFPFYPDFPPVENRPANLAKRAGALASVGGGFMMTASSHTGVTGQPVHALALDDEIWTTGLGKGGKAYMNASGVGWIEDADIKVSANQFGMGNSGISIRIEHINRGNEGVCAFTWRGGSNEHPKAKEGRYHALLTRPQSTMSLDGTAASYSVFLNPLSLTVNEDDIILEADEPFTFDEAHPVVWRQKFDENDTQGISLVAGMTMLLADGENVVHKADLWGGASQGPDNWYIRKNPRTGIAVSKWGSSAYIVVCEGRVSHSKGLRLREFANFIKSIGGYDAMNLDGGGSTHMWIKDGGLVADSCYGNGTIAGTRPNIYATAVF